MPGVPPARYAYLGPEGTFTEQALRTLPAAAKAELLPCGSVSAALDAVRDSEADGAVVPIENSVEGGVAVTIDELSSGDPLMITREMHVEVQFALMAKHGTEVSAIKRVATHPHAQAQCRRWLATHLPDAAVAAPIAAQTYRLATLATSIADSAGAVTRFVLVSRPGTPPAPTGADKTSLVAFIRDNHPGALLELLEQFAARGVDLTRIESRPAGSELGKYCFSLDCEGHVADARVGEALMGLRRTCDDVRFLGSYPRADGAITAVSPGTSDGDFTDASAWLRRLRS
jgi:prephenate dehydratase